jgi:alpha-tubulin suppressor-like RCC1 family protein
VGHDNSLEVNVSTPVLVQGLPDLTSATKINLKIENQTACLHADKDVYCWGAGVGTLLSLGTDNTFKAHKISELSGNIEKLAIIHSGVCVAYDTNKVSCLSSTSSNLIAFDRKEVYKKTFPAIGAIEELEGGAYLLCQVLKNGKLYCLGNNSYGGLAHAGIASPLVLNPEKWLP